ncbi:hypothetical protein ACVW07_002173 [Cellulomonas sp. URHB0016]
MLLQAGTDPTWLPRGSRADVMLGEPPADEPTGLVRLMVLRAGEIFCMPRESDDRLDLPTRTVPPGADPHAVARALASAVLGLDSVVRPWGYIRNLVLDPPTGYPWPTPVACFSVWRPVSGEPVVSGVWQTRTELGERHWWPLAAHAARSARPASSIRD